MRSADGGVSDSVSADVRAFVRHQHSDQKLLAAARPEVNQLVGGRAGGQGTAEDRWTGGTGYGLGEVGRIGTWYADGMGKGWARGGKIGPWTGALTADRPAA